MVELDEYGRRKNRNYRPQPLSGFQHTVRHPYRRQSAWDRFDDFISDIGDWFDYNGENLSLYISWGIMGLALIGFVIWVIQTWVERGFWSALFRGAIGGVIGYYALAIAIAVISLILRGVCWVLSIVFKSGISLIVTLLITGSVFLVLYFVNM